jgi:hypothetical protein
LELFEKLSVVFEERGHDALERLVVLDLCVLPIGVFTAVP